METKKLERIIILILLLLNAVLLALLLRGRLEETAARRERLEMITALLEDNGITPDRELDLLQEGTREYTVVRDLEREEQRMQGFLGVHTSEDLGGGIWFYRSDSGQIVMRGTGELNILPTGESGSRSRSREDQARQLMRKGGLELWAPASAASDPDELLLCCCWEGCPVFNAVMEFSFSDTRMDLVTGTVVFNREAEGSVRQGMDAVSLLVRFVDTVKRDGILCSRLTELTPGYFMNVGRNGESTLTPVWRLVTDVGEFYADALTGELVSLPA